MTYERQNLTGQEDFRQNLVNMPIFAKLQFVDVSHWSNQTYSDEYLLRSFGTWVAIISTKTSNLKEHLVHKSSFSYSKRQSTGNNEKDVNR